MLATSFGAQFWNAVLMTTVAMPRCSKDGFATKRLSSCAGLIVKPNAFTVVASVDEEIVGFGAVLETGEVTLCYVAPSVRFKGAGKALLAALEQHVARAGAEALRLESTRTAREFYLRNGFVTEGAPVQAFGIDGQPMRKELRPGC